MRIAISGAHRTGKTTLAKALAARLECMYEPSNISGSPVWKLLGMDPTAVLTFSERAVLQNKLLEYLESRYASFTGLLGNWITDRSPVDILAYLMANVDGTCSDLFYDIFAKMQTKVKQINDNYIDITILVQPGISFDGTCPEDKLKVGKVYLSEIYKETLNSLIFAQTTFISSSQTSFVVIPRNVITIDNRVKFVEEIISSLPL